MTESEMKERIEKLAEINEELFRMVCEMSKYIRELENLDKWRRLEKI